MFNSVQHKYPRSPIQVQQILGYLYKQNVKVVKNSDFLPYRSNNLVYAAPLQIFKGVDNKFQFIIKNNDQKPVSLLDCTAIFNLIDPTTKELVLSRTLQLVYNVTGSATVTIEDTFLNDISAGMYNYSILIISPEGEEQIVYSDDNFSAQGQAKIVDNVYPAFVPSINAKILQYGNNSDTNYLNVAFTDVAMVSDKVKSRAVDQTVQYNTTGFTGIIECQATLDASADRLPINWFPIQDVTLTNFTGNGFFTFYGKFSAIRFKITQTVGTVNYILYRS